MKSNYFDNLKIYNIIRWDEKAKLINTYLIIYIAQSRIDYAGPVDLNHHLLFVLFLFYINIYYK